MRTAVSSSAPTHVASDGARFSTSGSMCVKNPLESDGATVAWRRQYGRPRTIRLCSSHHAVPHLTWRRSTYVQRQLAGLEQSPSMHFWSGTAGATSDDVLSGDCLRESRCH